MICFQIHPIISHGFQCYLVKSLYALLNNRNKLFRLFLKFRKSLVSYLVLSFSIFLRHYFLFQKKSTPSSATLL
jgi:hypothetical protein